MLPKTMDWTLTAVPHQCGDVVELPVGNGPVVVPRFEDGADGAPELLHGVFGKPDVQPLLDGILEARDQVLQVVDAELGVELYALLLLRRVDDLLEGVLLFLGLGFEAQHHVAIHGHEAAVAVVGEPLVPGDARRGPFTVVSLRPRLRTVSIMPGMLARAPERMESRSGFLGSPNFMPMISSTFLRSAATSSFNPSGYSGYSRRKAGRPRW